MKVLIWLAETFFHVSFTSLQPVIREKDACMRSNKKIGLKKFELEQKSWKALEEKFQFW
jgi:hypothetical protein